MESNIVAWLVAGVVALLSLIEVTKIKINPWSWIFGRIGKMVNKELLTKVDALGKKLDNHIADAELRTAVQCRVRILRFADELIAQPDRLHTLEHFNQILDDITAYEHYCDDHPNFENEKAVLSAAHIKRVYAHCQEKHSFS